MKFFGIPRSLKRNILCLGGGSHKIKAEKRQKDEDLARIAEKDRKIFSFETLAAATDQFNAANKLGQGGFGSVHKGTLKDGTEIAVKRLLNTTAQGRLDFIKEAELLTGLQHRNVVKLLGYCADNNEYLLVYELLPYSLDQRLFRAKEAEKLDWKQIERIIIGIAKGLLYLHCYSRDVMLHRDIKPSNILLDHNGEPKITDFGVSRLFDKDKTHVVTRPAGTLGYIAPEYLDHGHASLKTDVYSFGVVVLELVTGKRYSYSPEIDNPTGLLDWAYKLFKQGRISDIMNPALTDSAVMEQVANCIEIGLRCTQGNPKSRPDMELVVSMLTSCQGHNGLPIVRPGTFGYRGYHSGSLSAFAELKQDQSNQFEALMPVDEHQEAIQSQGNQSEAQVLVGAKIPHDMLVDEHQSQQHSSNSSQIILEDPHSNSNTFLAQHDSASGGASQNQGNKSEALVPKGAETANDMRVDEHQNSLSLSNSNQIMKEDPLNESSTFPVQEDEGCNKDEEEFLDLKDTQSKEKRGIPITSLSEVTVDQPHEKPPTLKMKESGAEGLSRATMNVEPEEESKELGQLMALKEELRQIRTAIIEEWKVISEAGVDLPQSPLSRLLEMEKQLQRSLVLASRKVYQIFKTNGKSVGFNIFSSYFDRLLMTSYVRHAYKRRMIQEPVKNWHKQVFNESWYLQMGSWVPNEYVVRKDEKKREEGMEESSKQNNDVGNFIYWLDKMYKYEKEMSSSYGRLKELGKKYEKGKWVVPSIYDNVLLWKDSSCFHVGSSSNKERLNLSEIDRYVKERLEDIDVGIKCLDRCISSSREWNKGLYIIQRVGDWMGTMMEARTLEESCSQQVYAKQFLGDNRFSRLEVTF